MNHSGFRLLSVSSILVLASLATGCSSSDKVGEGLVDMKSFESNADQSQVRQQASQLGTVLDGVGDRFAGREPGAPKATGSGTSKALSRRLSPLSAARSFLAEGKTGESGDHGDGSAGGDDFFGSGDFGSGDFGSGDFGSGDTGFTFGGLPALDGDDVREGSACDKALAEVSASYGQIAGELAKMVEMVSTFPEDGAELGGVKVKRTASTEYPIGLSFESSEASNQGKASVEGFIRAAGDTRGLFKLEVENKSSVSFDIQSIPSSIGGDFKLGGAATRGEPSSLAPLAEVVKGGGSMRTSTSMSLKSAADLNAKLVDLEADTSADSSFGDSSIKTSVSMRTAIKGGDAPSVSNTVDFSISAKGNGKSEDQKGSVSMSTALTGADELTLKADLKLNGENGSMQLVLKGRGEACKVASFKSSMPAGFKGSASSSSSSTFGSHDGK